jgi:cysteinyl-tRNA synthetase
MPALSRKAMDDDFGTPEAVAVLFDLANRINAGDRPSRPSCAGWRDPRAAATRADELPASPSGGGLGGMDPGKIAEREAARKRKDYAAADRIRKECWRSGIALEDKGGKTTGAAPDVTLSVGYFRHVRLVISLMTRGVAARYSVNCTAEAG